RSRGLGDVYKSQGSYLTGSLLLGDMNAVMGCVLLVGVIFVMLNLLSDMLYQLFDPRTKS
ncbi:hypothetical protein GRW62_30260, partial [Escherichia coli]|nr:hypothetical protein [Escherichia coli]